MNRVLNPIKMITIYIKLCMVRGHNEKDHTRYWRNLDEIANLEFDPEHESHVEPHSNDKYKPWLGHKE